MGATGGTFMAHGGDRRVRSGSGRGAANSPPVWLYAGYALVLAAGAGFATGGWFRRPDAPSMLRLRLLSVSEWGFGRQQGVKVPVPGPPGIGAQVGAAPSAAARPGAVGAFAAYAGSAPGRAFPPNSLMARYGFPGPPFPPRRMGGGSGRGARRFRLLFPGRDEAHDAPYAPDSRLRTLFLARPAYYRLSQSSSGMARTSPPAGRGGGTVYHEIHLPPGASVSEGVLARLATEGDGWRIGPVVVVRIDAVVAVPE